MLKSRFSAGRLRDRILGIKPPRRKLIIDRGWGVLLDIGAFSPPKGLLEWIILKIDPDLGEFRNPRNNTSILFNKEMVIKALGLPRGTRPVVLTGDHEESPYREFYKIEYRTAGRRAPISNAEKMLENADLDDETWFRTFFLVVIGTYFFPGTSIMLPLEYLGSLGDSSLVREYDWAEQIFRHTMSEIKSFQEKMRKTAKDGNIKPLWVGGCLPWIAVYSHCYVPHFPGQPSFCIIFVFTNTNLLQPIDICRLFTWIIWTSPSQLCCHIGLTTTYLEHPMFRIMTSSLL
jgi:hypothetical protein